ncbi:Crp/Fnr family transcriptional regulator [Enterovirga sp. DB1703]|uniref:Crp/Fnr family transcriptional regulator n=2 Tax=Enterovirga aerilata TaxID=2730920 RepID=A0A849IB45_9HYPH|nr:Crp/Fnr family transcriptional regulator [Enterovirga sp. DB1703]
MGQSAARNQLLAALPEKDLTLLSPAMELVSFEPEQTIIEPFAAITHVHFLQSGLLSVIARSGDREQAEIAMIGREGMAGFSLALGCSSAPFHIFVQRAGNALRMSAEAFRQACHDSPALHRAVLLYSHVFMTQVAETSRANARHTVETRLARWLLMAHDRSDGDDLPLTHEFLSLMLGVRRPGITVSLHVLEGERMIRARRGNIRILDRAKLEQAARGSYGLPEAEYRRLMKPSPAEATAAPPANRSGPYYSEARPAL